jgi:hypothetical protein
MLESVAMGEGPVVTDAEIAEGLRRLGLSASSSGARLATVVRSRRRRR